MEFTKPSDNQQRPGVAAGDNRSLSSPPVPTPAPIPAAPIPKPMPAPEQEPEPVKVKRYLENKDDILDADDEKIVEVDIPEWDGTVYLKGLTAAQRDKFEMSCQRKTGGVDLTNVRAKLSALCIVDRNGNLLFPSPQDVIALGKKSGKALDRIYTEVQKINRLTDEEIEELAKN